MVQWYSIWNIPNSKRQKYVAVPCGHIQDERASYSEFLPALMGQAAGGIWSHTETRITSSIIFQESELDGLLHFFDCKHSMFGKGENCHWVEILWEKDMLEVSASVHCFFSNRVFWLNSWLCFCLTILPSCSKSQVCKRRRLQSGSCRRGAFEMRCPLVFHGFSMFFSTDSRIHCLWMMQ